MEADYDAIAAKRPLKLSLNADPVARARVTGNPSEVVEGLVAELLAEKKAEQDARTAARTVVRFVRGRCAISNPPVVQAHHRFHG